MTLWHANPADDDGQGAERNSRVGADREVLPDEKQNRLGETSCRPGPACSFKFEIMTDSHLCIVIAIVNGRCSGASVSYEPGGFDPVTIILFLKDDDHARVIRLQPVCLLEETLRCRVVA